LRPKLFTLRLRVQKHLDQTRAALTVVRRRAVWCSFLLFLGGPAATSKLTAAETNYLFSGHARIWQGEVGEGFKAGANDLGVSYGAGLGMRILGSEHRHYFAIGLGQFGWMLGDVHGQERWYKGNWELAIDLFGGQQYYPSAAYLVGGGPILRYNFATGSRCVPFVQAGAGASATDIRDGDLSTTFEFNLQIGAGVHLFMRDDVAFTLEYRFMHLSNAGLDAPNLGVNESVGLLGITWFF
jgi:lipid A 3-O-deacylase